jgi:hypothetical protein
MRRAGVPMAPTWRSTFDLLSANDLIWNTSRPAG